MLPNEKRGTLKARRRQKAKAAERAKMRAKEKPQRKTTAYAFLIVSLTMIAGPIIIVVVSHQMGGDIRLPLKLIPFDALLVSVTIWACYDWLK